MWRNSDNEYGKLNKVLHWLIAAVIISLFALGLWMTSLSYYDEWYRRGPYIHRSIGVLLMVLMLSRLMLVFWMGKPKPSAGHTKLEVTVARLVHVLLYLLVFAIGLSGYLLSTADGRGIEVFTWFTVPSSGEWFSGQEDVAGDIHLWLACGMMGLVVAHALAALKHQFIDKDNTLKRML